MISQPTRKYADIVSRLKASLDVSGKLLSLGQVASSTVSHSIDKIVLGGANNGNRVLISAGIHGDEPAGVETICAFIESKQYLKYLPDWEITLAPCLNPFGYEADTRTNHEGVDLNRKFKSSSPPHEVALAKSLFHSTFDLTIELHEDVDSWGFYFFHLSKDSKRPALVSAILNSVGTVMPINMDSEIDEISADGGVIDRKSMVVNCDLWPMAFYSLHKGTRTCLTLETATEFPMRTRVKAHLKAIDTALEKFGDEEP